HLPRLVPADALNGIDADTLVSSPQQLLTLPPAVLEGVREAFGQSLSTVFLLGVPLAVAAFALSWFLPQVALRERSTGAAKDGGDESPEGATVPLVLEA